MELRFQRLSSLSKRPSVPKLLPRVRSSTFNLINKFTQSFPSDKPLKIITGRGSHSVNQVSVLKPAVRKALVEDGWNVASWDGGLVVRGKHVAVAAS